MQSIVVCSGRPEIGVGCDYSARAMSLGSFGKLAADVWQECVQPLGTWNIPGKDPLFEIRVLARQGARERQAMEEQELLRLHGLWLAAGGECVSAGLPLVELTRGEQVVRGGILLHSELWGEIDLMRLNRGLLAYQSGGGLADLARDLALATGRFQMDIRKLPKDVAVKAGKKHAELMRDQGWKGIFIDWRRAQYLVQIMSSSSFERMYAGAAGYDRFAEEFFLGDSGNAYKIASALLSRESFAALGWGKAKLINVKHQAALRT
ncbi:MAG: hypothetical protein AB1664_19220, partial [Thermodesulfobacteriota bacterium]